MSSVLQNLVAAVAAVPGLPTPSGLGAVDVLEQTEALAGAITVLWRELVLRMEALRLQNVPTDVSGDAVRAGMSRGQAGKLRRLGQFAARWSTDCPAVAACPPRSP